MVGIISTALSAAIAHLSGRAYPHSLRGAFVYCFVVRCLRPCASAHSGDGQGSRAIRADGNTSGCIIRAAPNRRLLHRRVDTKNPSAAFVRTSVYSLYKRVLRIMGR